MRVAPLYGSAIKSPRAGPLFNAFSYPTKIAPETIALFIACHTRPGDTVLDTFAGSGTTGIAVRLCDAPTDNMLRMAVALGISPEWGPRHAELYDIGTLGAFVARVMTGPPDPNAFAAAATQLLDEAERQIGWVYGAVSPDGQDGTIRHIVWSELLRCPECATDTSYWDASLRRDPLAMSKTFTCPRCRSDLTIAECERVVESGIDPILGHAVETRVRVPARIFGKGPGGAWQRAPVASDLVLAAGAAGARIPSGAPITPIHWGDLHRSGYHHGMTHVHHLYTPRNFFVLASLWELVEQASEDLRDALRLLILSFNGAHSTLMTRVVVKKGGVDLALTGAQSGVLYVSGLPVEKNILLGLRRKLKTLQRAFAVGAGTRSSVRVSQASSVTLDLPDRSVDYVFTDPPFGAYIPYAEVNEVNEVWLGLRTDRSQEIVVSSSAGKDVAAYGDMMSSVFSEVARVLKPDGSATVIFHSAHPAIWAALRRAYKDAGFAVGATGLLNKTQASFKQVVSAGSVKGDPVIELRRDGPPPARPSERSPTDIVMQVVAEAEATGRADEVAPERLFSRYITRCLVEDVPISMSASEFYGALGVRR